MKIAVILFLFSFSAFAQNACEAEKISEVLEESDVLFLELIRVRTVLEVSVEIPGISSVSVNPEIELYFSRN